VAGLGDGIRGPLRPGHEARLGLIGLPPTRGARSGCGCLRSASCRAARIAAPQRLRATG
jgi:predicted small integral membrane protein